MSMDLAVETQEQRLMEISDTPQVMAMKLADMKTKLDLVQKFFREVMVQGQDYGVIPGTDKPTLLKPGAEKLNELYGYAPVVKSVEETVERDSGFYRARVVIALVHRRTGITVAEGVGEANSLEGRYRWRWVPEWKLPKNVDKSSLYSEERENRDGKRYIMYRAENSDPWALWNTILKMAKKRALVDATLSATRSSGLFNQDLEDLEEWVAGGEVSARSSDSQAQAKRGNGGSKPATEAQVKKLHALAKEKGIGEEGLDAYLTERYGNPSAKALTLEQASQAIDALSKMTAQGVIKAAGAAQTKQEPRLFGEAG